MKKNYLKTICILVSIILVSCSEEVNLTSEADNSPSAYIPKDIESESNGLLGQLIWVKGKDFLLDSLSFYFNDIASYAYLKNNDTLQIKVPRELEQVESNFKILLGYKDSLVHSSNFKLRKPEITKYSQNKVTFGEEFWVYGKNFDNDDDYISTFINDKRIWPSYLSHDSIKVKIPNDILQKRMSVKVKAQLQEDIKNNNLELYEPIINKVSSEVFIGSNNFMLEGEYFNPDTQYSKIIINDEIETHIYNTHNNKKIELLTPYGPYKDFRIYNISYETAGMLVKKNVDIKIKSNHILYSKNHPVSYTSYNFIFNNEFYVISSESNSTNSPSINYLWKFNFTTQEWTKDERIQIPAYGIHITEIKNGVLFIYKNAESDGLLKLNMNDFSLENITNIPKNENRVAPCFFIHGNYLYLGKGKNSITFNSHKDLYRLNLDSMASSSWEEVSTDNNIFTQEQTFVNNGTLYISGQTLSSSSTNYSLLKFNPSNSNFEIVNNYSFEKPFFIFLNNKYYRISINPNTRTKRIYDFDEQYTDQFSFHLNNSNTDHYDHSYFSFKNEIYFITRVINDAYWPSVGIYKLSDDLKNQFN